MKVKFITFGCSRNQADSELMKGLVNKKHELVTEEEDVTVINSCFVKGETEKKIIKLMKQIKNKVVLTGCLAQARPQLIDAFPKNSFIGVNQLERINEAIEKQVIDISDGEPNFCKERILTNPLISIVPISSGCLGSCTYCCTKQARGWLKSRSTDSIINQIKQDLSRGVKELWITSQDTGCYGFDKNTNLAELLNSIINLKNDFKVRVGMMNPQHALKILPELRKVFESKKIYKFIHVPVQSGSNKVLKDMNRGYTINDFKKVIKSFKGFTISTDIIAGYPTETINDWKKTIKLIQWLKPRVLNISRFFPRPGTEASKLKQLPSGISKDRTRELTRIYLNQLKELKQEIGTIHEVLITEKNKGRDEFYRVINVKAPIGSKIKVKIINSNNYTLNGELIH